MQHTLQSMFFTANVGGQFSRNVDWNEARCTQEPFPPNALSAFSLRSPTSGALAGTHSRSGSSMPTATWDRFSFLPPRIVATVLEALPSLPLKMSARSCSRCSSSNSRSCGSRGSGGNVVPLSALAFSCEIGAPVVVTVMM